jgi:ribonuclease G
MELFIDKNIFSTKVKLMKNSKLFDFNYIIENNKNLIGNIYLGKIINVIPNMKTIFIDIGLGKNAYLDFSNIYGDLSTKEIVNNYYIGKEILVQISKNLVDKKGPKVTEDISISSNNLVLLPKENKLFISKKIKDIKTIAKLKNNFDIIRDNYGLIMRTSAKEIDFKILEIELNSLKKIWNEIIRQKVIKSKTKIVYSADNEYNQFIIDYYSKINKVVVNSTNIYNKLTPKKDYQFDVVYDEKLNLTNDLININNNNVFLENGINLKIDYTEALTVIDVNSGKYISKNDVNGIYKVNSYALKEIARQLAIKNISGIIIIDLINFKNVALGKKLVNEFRYELNQYKNKFNLFGFTHTGLLEMTRQYTNKNLNELIKNINYEADLILSNLKEIIFNTKSKKLEISASNECIELIKNNENFNKFIDDNNLKLLYKISEKVKIKHLPF